MVEVRNIVLMGRTGNGKSTVGNVLINKNGKFEEVFKESEFAVSETRNTYFEELEIEGIRYRIIDTVGFGDTSLSEEEVANKIADVAHLVSNGLSQILFITKGRFNKEEIQTYNNLRTKVFDENIVNYTTIIRTHFQNFRDKVKCKLDKEKMLKEGKEIAEVIDSCQKVIHVDNPSLNIEDERRLVLNKEDREFSRDILINCLKKCHGIYKPKNLDGLNELTSDKVAEKDKIIKILEEGRELDRRQREKLEKELAELKTQIAQQTQGWFKRAGALLGEAVDNVVEVVTYPIRNCNIN